MRPRLRARGGTARGAGDRINRDRIRRARCTSVCVGSSRSSSRNPPSRLAACGPAIGAGWAAHRLVPAPLQAQGKEGEPAAWPARAASGEAPCGASRKTFEAPSLRRGPPHRGGPLRLCGPSRQAPGSGTQPGQSSRRNRLDGGKRLSDGWFGPAEVKTQRTPMAEDSTEGRVRLPRRMRFLAHAQPVLLQEQRVRDGELGELGRKLLQERRESLRGGQQQAGDKFRVRSGSTSRRGSAAGDYPIDANSGGGVERGPIAESK